MDASTLLLIQGSETQINLTQYSSRTCWFENDVGASTQLLAVASAAGIGSRGFLKWERPGPALYAPLRGLMRGRALETTVELRLDARQLGTVASDSASDGASTGAACLSS